MVFGGIISAITGNNKNKRHIERELINNTTVNNTYRTLNKYINTTIIETVNKIVQSSAIRVSSQNLLEVLGNEVEGDITINADLSSTVLMVADITSSSETSMESINEIKDVVQEKIIDQIDNELNNKVKEGERVFSSAIDATKIGAMALFGSTIDESDKTRIEQITTKNMLHEMKKEITNIVDTKAIQETVNEILIAVNNTNTVTIKDNKARNINIQRLTLKSFTNISMQMLVNNSLNSNIASKLVGMTEKTFHNGLTAKLNSDEEKKSLHGEAIDGLTGLFDGLFDLLSNPMFLIIAGAVVLLFLFIYMSGDGGGGGYNTYVGYGLTDTCDDCNIIQWGTLILLGLTMIHTFYVSEGLTIKAYNTPLVNDKLNQDGLCFVKGKDAIDFIPIDLGSNRFLLNDSNGLSLKGFKTNTGEYMFTLEKYNSNYHNQFIFEKDGNRILYFGMPLSSKLECMIASSKPMLTERNMEYVW